jgi:plastocyanin
MDSHGAGNGEHGEEHGVHLPDPSAWPLVVGLAAFVLGAALIWWSRDRDNHVAGILLGVGIAFVLSSIAGWAWDDSRMRAKAESGHGAAPRAARYTQVLAFAVAEGQLAAARGRQGVIGRIEEADLHNYEGFEDLRVTAAPAASGPAQVLVETTWRGRDGFQSYEATRQTLLDIVNGEETQVLPGTVQVFDMDVVRDTKDTAFRFSSAAAVTVLGALILGGFGVGAGLNLFSSEASAGGGGPAATPTPADPYKVVARDNKFATSTLAAPPNTQVTFTFTNSGKTKHNLAFRKANDDASDPVADGAVGNPLDGGATEQITFTTPGPGTYYFFCDFHPTEMFGTFTVDASAPPPGGAPAPGGSPTAAGSATAAAGGSATATATK